MWKSNNLYEEIKVEREGLGAGSMAIYMYLFIKLIKN